MTEEGKGYLRIRVWTADGALPVENAIVTISDYNGEESGGEILYSLRTDNGGLTQVVFLPAPPKSNSQHPGETPPYSLYTVAVSKEGYYTVENVGVMVFDGVVAIQPVNLIPFSESDAIAGTSSGKIVIMENRRSERERENLEEDSEGGMQ